MTASLLLALACGAVVGAGVLMFVMAMTGMRLGDPSRPSLIHRVTHQQRSSATNRLALAVGAGLLTLLATRWPVMAVGIGLLVAYWDRIVGSSVEERLSIARLEALAVWTESLRDTIAGAIGLEQAIPASVSATPPALRPSLNLLVDRLRIREPMPDALLAFADDLDDASADTVVAALVLNSRLRGPGLRDVLGALAQSTREELDMRRRVEAGRRTIRRSVKIVLLVVLTVVGGMSVLNRTYVEPYSGLTGQLVLSLVGMLFVAGLLWLRRLARPAQIERFLVASKEQVEKAAAAAAGDRVPS